MLKQRTISIVGEACSAALLRCENARLVTDVSCTNSDLSKNGLLGENYMIHIQLTKKAREALAMTVEGTKTRWITVVVDGKCWNIRRNEPSNEQSGYSKSIWAKYYSPSFGFFSSKAEAQRIVDALI